MSFDVSLQLVERIRDIASEAGAEILRIYNHDFAVDTKADSSPVTEADRVAEALILDRLREIADRFPIVAEESFAAGHVPDVGDTPFWLVDPLDGTKEFIKRNGEFTVNIALIENAHPVLGVVHAPAIADTYWGSRHGAFAESGGGAARRIAVRRPSPAGLVVLASRSHRSPELDRYLADFKVKEETSAGSSLKFCLVAAGKADLYPHLGRTMEWDTAAGHAVVGFAGGSVSVLDGGELTYAKPGFENPHFVVKGIENGVEEA